MTSDPVWSRDEIQSPCVRICVVHQAHGMAPILRGHA